MITIQHAVNWRGLELPPERRFWQHYCSVNCHGIQAFEVVMTARTKREAHSFYHFLHRIAELTAEWWELDNYPCH